MQHRKYQQDAVKVAAGKSRAGLEMVTGSGKSFTMGLLIHALQLRTLVIVPNLALKEQLKTTFTEMFGSLNNICVENIDSPKLKMETNYDVLIIDECHHAASATYRKLNASAWKGIYHRYFFSGTFFRNQESEALIFEGVAGPLCYRYSYADAVKDGSVVPVEAFYIESPALLHLKGNLDSWSDMYSELVVDNIVRNNLIRRLLVLLHNAKVSTLCLVKEVIHGVDLSSGGAFPFAQGQDGEAGSLIKSHADGVINTLVATTGVAGEGVDTKSCEFVIIAGLGKSKPLLMQMIGRAIRPYPGKESAKIVLILDRSHKWTISHFKAQVKILKEEYGIKPVKLDLP